jgi:DNA-binding NarL/FixJ family response regulator
MMIRILIAEDHPVLRAALRALLETEPDFEVVDEAADTDEALRLADQARPDVVLLDLGLPDLRGFGAVRLLRQAPCDSQVLLLMDYEDAGLARDALLAGASGCVISQLADSTLVAAVRAVSQGQLYIQQCLMRALLADLAPRAAWPQEGSVDLSSQELDVLRLIAQGYTNRQMAEELGLSVRTVGSHREKIMVKLGLHSRVELARYAAARRLVQVPR